MDTLETVYEHLKYEGDPKEDYAMTSAYDHRKAELTVGKLYDHIRGSRSNDVKNHAKRLIHCLY